MKYWLSIVLLFFVSCGGNTLSDERSWVDTAAQEKGVILALGDSLTAGYGLENSQSYPSKLQVLLDEGGYDYQVINAGVSGDTYDNIASRASLYVDKHPQIVILVVGGNDGLRGLSVENMKQNIVEIIDTFPESVIVLGGMELPLNLGMQYVKDFKNVYKEIASERKNIVFIESFLEGVAGKSQYNISDMIHPNGEGYEIIVKNLMKVLEKQKIIKK